MDPSLPSKTRQAHAPSGAFTRKWLGISLALHLCAAWFSVGYHDADEQFQILEFLNARLGRSSFQDLPWEYPAQMRSWFQPMAYEGLGRMLRTLGIDDPFQWATAMRFVSALIGWLSIVALVRCVREWFPTRFDASSTFSRSGSDGWYRWAVRLVCLFPLLPYLHARTSSENLGGSFFLLGFLLLAVPQAFPRLSKLRPSLQGALGGMLLGLSFLSRFQMGFAIAALAAWLLASMIGRSRDPDFGQKPPALSLVSISVGFIAILGFGVCLDYRGYGHLTFSPWNYLEQNILAGKAAAMGTQPWDYYFVNLAETLPPWGTALVLGIVAAWIGRPKHVLSVTSFAFVLGHTVVAHKEPRFLYPFAAEAPVLFMLGLEACAGRLAFLDRKWPKKSLVALAAVLLAIHVAVLLGLTFKPASAQIGFYAAAYRHEPPLDSLAFKGLNPYRPMENLLSYYRRPEMALRALGSYDELARELMASGSQQGAKLTWLFYERDELGGDAMVLRPYCRLEYTTFPAWLKGITFLPGLSQHANRWSIYRCGKGT